MPTLRTEASELAVGFGILSLDPLTELQPYEIERYFEGSLSSRKYQDFLHEYPGKNNLHSRMHKVGLELRKAEPLFSSVKSIRWAGPDRQAATATASSDLLVANTPVSVKAISNVVANPSPHNLLINLPSGLAFAKNEENWYLIQDPSGYQNLYAFVRNSSMQLSHFPNSIEEFERIASSTDRKTFQRIIKDYPEHKRKQFTRCYLDMCHTVASKSAEVFNTSISKSLQSKSKSTITENLMRWFFRLDSNSYLLCGIDGSNEFGVRIPSITQWKSDWTLDSITASPDLSRRQSVVDFELKFTNRSNHESSVARFHTELRWSHGRFCGSPEAKLYKEFYWRDLPIFIPLV